jgi:hypothetical protein
VVNLKNPDQLFLAFLKEKRILDGASPATIRIYSKSRLAFNRYNAEITESGIKNFMVSMIIGGEIKPSNER